MHPSPGIAIRERCAFSADGESWKCGKCGRSVRRSSERPPVATCRTGGPPRQVVACTFSRNESGDHACVRCGATLKAKPGYSPSGMCGQPGAAAMVWNGPGVGDALKSMLSKIGIVAKKGCQCNQRSREMNLRGPDWCEENIDTVVGWLEEEAKSRRFPLFSRTIAYLLVRRAIKRVRKSVKAS